MCIRDRWRIRGGSLWSLCIVSQYRGDINGTCVSVSRQKKRKVNSTYFSRLFASACDYGALLYIQWWEITYRTKAVIISLG